MNGNGSGPKARAKRNTPNYMNWLKEGSMGAAATTELYLGNRIDNLAKWEGTFRYGGMSNVLTQKQINAKAIVKNPLLKTRPVNIIRQYSLPRPQAIKLAKGLTGLGYASAALTTLQTGNKLSNGEISTAHAVGTIAMVAGGLVLTTAGAPVVIAAIIVGGLYGIYEDDIWHDYDKVNATNFKEPEE